MEEKIGFVGSLKNMFVGVVKPEAYMKNGQHGKTWPAVIIVFAMSILLYLFTFWLPYNKLFGGGRLARTVDDAVEDFALTNDGFYYADKTGLIEQLLNQWGKVNLFTRPRRFGKTLNMSMLHRFFEIGADASLFDGLSISRRKNLCDEYLGKFPVQNYCFGIMDRRLSFLSMNTIFRWIRHIKTAITGKLCH